MAKELFVDGLIFRINNMGYYYNQKQQVLLHRYIWEKHNGKIPKGFHIHHIDKDKLNNDISNLQAISPSEHGLLHARELNEDDREELRKNMIENLHPKAKEWHKSKAGSEWHKYHYEKHKHLLHKEMEFNCAECGETYTGVTNGKNKFCSGKCNSRWRRKNGIDNVKRFCIVCNSEFTTNKHSKAQRCSMKCVGISNTKDSPN